MSEISFSARAYCKIILHAAKYPHCTVNGLILTKNTNNKNEKVEIVDTVPLFHIAINLIPMAEIALMQVDDVAAKKGLTIAGYYVAHENLRDNTFEKAHHRISDKIALNCSSPYLVVVNNSSLCIPLNNVALKVAQYLDGSYKPCDKGRICLNPAKTLDVCSKLVERGFYESLIDFDNHLDNVNLDWMNYELNEEIDALL